MWCHGLVQLGMVSWMLLTKMAPDTFSQPYLRPRFKTISLVYASNHLQGYRIKFGSLAASF